MNVLIAYSGDDERPHIRKLFAFLKKRGDQVSFAGWDRKNRKQSTAHIRGVDCHFIQHGWGYANWKLFIALPLWAIRLLVYSLTTTVNVVVVSDLDSAASICLMCTIRRIPFI